MLFDVDELNKIAVAQIKKEQDLADELANLIFSYDLSDQERFNVVQFFKTKVLGDIPLYS